MNHKILNSQVYFPSQEGHGSVKEHDQLMGQFKARKGDVMGYFMARQ